MIMEIGNGVYFEIVLALLLGAMLGAERSFAGKTAGMRTYGLVSMGSCLLVIVSSSVLNSLGMYNVDPLRLAAGIVTGIGFLGAGVIVFKGSHLSGLTTAAGLWVACGVGIAVGFGLYTLATFTSILTLFVFTLLWFVEQKIIKARNGYESE